MDIAGFLSLITVGIKENHPWKRPLASCMLLSKTKQLSVPCLSNLNLDSVAVSIFVVILVEMTNSNTNKVFVIQLI